MIRKKKILAIIPARGGSKGIPGKNIRKLAGKPLIQYSIYIAKQSRHINKVVVSTDDSEIEAVALKLGVEMIKRPKELAQDNSLVIDAIKHTLGALKKKENYNCDAFIILQPTSPLRTIKDVDKAIELFLNNECESVVSVCEARKSLYWSLSFKKDGYIKPLLGWKYFVNKNRQDLHKFYLLNGAISITLVKSLYKHDSILNKKTLPYIMLKERSIDIDEEIDFKIAEFLLRENEKNQDK